MPKALIAVALVTLLVACGEQREAEYRSHAELLAAGSGSRSWFPTWLPPSATNLREWHDLDTNRTIGRFTVTGAFELPKSLCTPTRWPENPGSSVWWPGEARFAELEHFSCDEPMIFGDGRVESGIIGVAIDRTTGDIFFWRKPG